MSHLARIPISELVYHGRQRIASPTERVVWNLNLDQIESGSGRVLEKQMVASNELGSSTYPFEAGTVLYSKLRPYLNKVVVADKAGYATTELVPLRCAPERIFPVYLAHYLRSPEFVGFASNVVAGAKMPRMVMGEFWKHEIPLPPLSEQRRIAAILDHADALRAKRREALAQLDKLAQAIFVEMFGDPVINPKNWPRVTLQDLCDSAEGIKCGPFGTQLARSEFTAEGVPLWGIRNVNALFMRPTHEFVSAQTAARLHQYTIRVGDIVMTRKGTVGNCAIYPKGFPIGIMHSDLLRIRTNPDKCLPGFVSHQLHHSRDVERQLKLISGGAVMPGINVTKLKSLEVLLPPLQAQSRFGVLLEMLAMQEKRYQYAVNDVNRLFSSLQHRAFRGEL